MTNPESIDPQALGKLVGNYINGMPEHSTPADLQAATDAAKLMVVEAMEDFDVRVVPEENDPNLGTFDDA